MAKSKNHTNHNQSLFNFRFRRSKFICFCFADRKDHRNGIKRPKSQRFPSLTGVCHRKSSIDLFFLFKFRYRLG